MCFPPSKSKARQVYVLLWGKDRCALKNNRLLCIHMMESCISAIFLANLNSKSQSFDLIYLPESATKAGRYQTWLNIEGSIWTLGWKENHLNYEWGLNTSFLTLEGGKIAKNRALIQQESLKACHMPDWRHLTLSTAEETALCAMILIGLKQQWNKTVLAAFPPVRIVAALCRVKWFHIGIQFMTAWPMPALEPNMEWEESVAWVLLDLFHRGMGPTGHYCKPCYCVIFPLEHHPSLSIWNLEPGGCTCSQMHWVVTWVQKGHETGAGRGILVYNEPELSWICFLDGRYPSESETSTRKALFTE